MCAGVSAAKRQLKSKVYELRDVQWRQGESISLAPNACRVLDHIGVLDVLKRFGYPAGGMNFFGDNLKNIGHVDGVSGQYQTIRLLRKDLIDCLRTCMAQYPEFIDIQYNKRVVKVEQVEKFAQIEFEDGATETAELVVGTDGIRSKVREAIAPGVTPEYIGETVISSSIDAKRIDWLDGQAPKMPALLFTQYGAMGLMPYTPDGQQIGWFVSSTIPDKSREGWKKFEEGESLAYIRKHCASWPEVGDHQANYNKGGSKYY